MMIRTPKATRNARARARGVSAFLKQCNQGNFTDSGLPTKSFRTKSDSRTAFICANPAKRRFAPSAVNALIGASFRHNRART